MRIKTKRRLKIGGFTTLGGVLGILLGLILGSQEPILALKSLLNSTLGTNVLTIILILAIVFTGALFDFLSIGTIDLGSYT